MVGHSFNSLGSVDSEVKDSLEVASSLEGGGKQVIPIVGVSRPPEPISTGHGSAGDVLNGEGCSSSKGQKGPLSSICKDSKGTH